MAVLGSTAIGQEKAPMETAHNVAVIAPGTTAGDIIRKAAHVVPSPRQISWQEREFIAFVHFGTNTFTNREWGTGTESPSVFNPTAFDARQWVKVIRDAGMRMVIITAKHHDGLCLWPSRYTDHSIRNSPWRGGKGDVVGNVAAACREFGLKFGVYLSPWDRHEPTYGDSPKYNEFFRHQLRELLSNYGEISEVWFDGACGEGPNGKRQVYDWSSYYSVVRELQPGAVIAIMGPDVRWVGTESGYGRETEWSVAPDLAGDLDSIAAASQQTPLDGAFVPRDLTADDLGSREKILHARTLVWYPAETDVSIRPGWFYHPDQDARVKTPEQLVDIYYSSVGRNSVLLLNIPPDTRGRIHDDDIRSLMGMRRILNATFDSNLLAQASPRATSARDGHDGACAIDGDNGTYWTTEEGVLSATLECTLPSERTFDRAMLQEYIRVGQRVEGFHLEAWTGGSWKPVAGGTTIGYKRLLRFPPVTASRLRLVIDRSRWSPAISTFGVFKAPPRVTAVPEGGAFEDSLTVRLSTDGEGAAIHYTLDGTTPTVGSMRYTSPIVIRRTSTVTALAALKGELCVESTAARFTRCLRVSGITLEKPSSLQYPGRGSATLVDGMRGSTDLHDGRWLGFERDDMIAVLDLGRSRPVSRITAGFLQNQGSWIFLPSSVEVSISSDGGHWVMLPAVSYPLKQSEEVLVRDLTVATGRGEARYVRIVARNVGTCPPWHPGAGGKAWLFVDEIIVE
jgi:alpha-L-fucosidase